MTTQQTNGQPRPSTRERTTQPERPVSRDPDRLPTRPTDFWTLPEGTTLVICGRCSCPIPDTDRAKRIHREHHATVDAGLPR